MEIQTIFWSKDIYVLTTIVDEENMQIYVLTTSERSVSTARQGADVHIVIFGDNVAIPRNDKGNRNGVVLVPMVPKAPCVRVHL